MGIERIKRWQWIVISLAVGWLVGFVWNQMDQGDMASLGRDSFSPDQQGAFERAMVTYETLVDANGKPIGKRPHFDDISVRRIADPGDGERPAHITRDGNIAHITFSGPLYKAGDTVTIAGADQREYNGTFKVTKAAKGSVDVQVSGRPATPATGKNLTLLGPPQLIYLVSGKYFTNEPTIRADKKVAYKWSAYYFLAPTPYVPATAFKAGVVSPGPSALQRLAELLHLREPEPPNTVVDYLRKASVANGVVFTYRWWAEPRFRLVAWVFGSFVLIGIVWPFVVNIMVFGTLSRPPEEKAPKLRKTKSTAAATKGPKNAITDKDMAELAALESELEKKLAAGAKPRSTTDVPEPVAQAPIKQLAGDGAPAPIPVPEKDDEQRVFAAKQDDFYPTERHISPSKPDKPD